MEINFNEQDLWLSIVFEWADGSGKTTQAKILAVLKCMVV